MNPRLRTFSLASAGIACAVCVGIFLFCGSVTQATVTNLQEATPSPTATPSPNPALEALDKRIQELEKQATIAQKEQEIAESEAAAATAEKSKILNLLPSPTSTPLAGSSTFEGTISFQGEMLAYRSLYDVAGDIGTDLGDGTGVIVIHNDADITALQSYGVVTSQLDAIIERYKVLHAELSPGGSEEVGAAAIFAAPQVASNLLRSVADIAALFRTNTVTVGAAITTEDSVINAAVADALRGKGYKVFEPKLYLPNLFNQTESPVMKKLGDVTQLKIRSENAVADFDALSAEEKKLRKKTIDKLKALDSQVDTFLTGLSTVNETTKQTALTGLYRAEKLKTLLGTTNCTCYVLHVKVVKAEGVRTTKSNLFTGTKTSYAGGIILAYTLFDRDGAIVRSGIHSSFRGSQNKKFDTGVLAHH